MTDGARLWIKVTVPIGVAFVLLLVVLSFLSTSREIRWEVKHTEGHSRLLVLGHGLLGRAQFESAISLAQDALPNSDLLIYDYDTNIHSNASPYAVANVIEREIHGAYAAHE